MKIGIVTQPLVNNYGGLLQNFALQTVLRKLGHDAITIDQRVFPPEKPIAFIYRNASVFVRNIVKTILRRGEIKELPYFRKRKVSYPSIVNKNFIDQYIKHTPIVYGKKQTRKLCRQMGINAYIVGSDQVWRKNMNSRMANNFLDFTEEQNVVRISYAASFGIDKWNFTKRETSTYKSYLKKFNAVSVRETSGVKLCRKYFEVDATCVLDPTLLLKATEYNKILDVDFEPNEKFLFAYMLDMTDEKKRFIANIADQRNLNVKLVSPASNSSESIPSVQKWLSLFRNSDFVICDSFHGMVFSIIYHKDFLAISNSGRGNARFFSLLELLGLDSRLVNEKQTESYENNSVQTIDWNMVDNKLEDLRSASIKFLQNNLYQRQNV